MFFIGSLGGVVCSTLQEKSTQPISIRKLPLIKEKPFLFKDKPFLSRRRMALIVSLVKRIL